jgi:hypothetical protein
VLGWGNFFYKKEFIFNIFKLSIFVEKCKILSILQQSISDPELPRSGKLIPDPDPAKISYPDPQHRYDD